MTHTALSDQHLLARLVGGSDDLARALLERFGCAGRALQADPSDLLHCPGMEEPMLATFETVRAAVSSVLRCEVSDKPILAAWDTVLDYLRGTMAHAPVETLRVLYLDRKNRLILDEIVWRGTVDHVPCYPREIMRRALELHSSALVMAHNHPSGDPSPSPADISMTRKVSDAAAALGIVLHDHVIVALSGHVSFRTAGLL